LEDNTHEPMNVDDCCCALTLAISFPRHLKDEFDDVMKDLVTICFHCIRLSEEETLSFKSYGKAVIRLCMKIVLAMSGYQVTP
jgi:hypothetical protein